MMSIAEGKDQFESRLLKYNWIQCELRREKGGSKYEVYFNALRNPLFALGQQKSGRLFRTIFASKDKSEIKHFSHTKYCRKIHITNRLDMKMSWSLSACQRNWQYRVHKFWQAWDKWPGTILVSMCTSTLA